MEQQFATMLQEMQSIRQFMAQQQQRHAEEIQRLQDRITMSKPNNWDTVNSNKNFKLFSGDQKVWDEFSTKFRSQVAAGDGGVAALMESVESVMLEEQAEAKDWELVKDDQCPVEAVQEISVKLHNVLLSLTRGQRGDRAMPRKWALGVDEIECYVEPQDAGVWCQDDLSSVKSLQNHECAKSRLCDSCLGGQKWRSSVRSMARSFLRR